jgi:diguanylate cyclase (GGDEF)-like protein
MFINKLLALGTNNNSFSDATKVRIMNIISIITVLVSALYTINYLVILHQPKVAFINSFFTLAYTLPLIFNYFGATKRSKLSFFYTLILHLFVCTNIYVTNESGFHLYYFLVPTGAFLLFNSSEKFEKISLSILAVILFFYCENTLNTSPLIILDEQTNHLLYQSVIFINMIEVIVVMTIFSNQIEVNETRLTRLATTDSLTGITNRHFFFEQGKDLLRLSNKHHRPFSLAIIDFDNFKKVNDTYGHMAGDSCLIETAKLVKRLCREYDIFARIGGEEFAIILPNTSGKDAEVIATNIQKTIENHIIFLTDNPHFSCTVSIGISSKSSTFDDFKSLLIQADKALYTSKEQGRNRVTVFDKVS